MERRGGRRWGRGSATACTNPCHNRPPPPPPPAPASPPPTTTALRCRCCCTATTWHSGWAAPAIWSCPVPSIPGPGPGPSSFWNGWGHGCGRWRAAPFNHPTLSRAPSPLVRWRARPLRPATPTPCLLHLGRWWGWGRRRWGWGNGRPTTRLHPRAPVPLLQPRTVWFKGWGRVCHDDGRLWPGPYAVGPRSQHLPAATHVHAWCHVLRGRGWRWGCGVFRRPAHDHGRGLVSSKVLFCF